jgi:hypothetical protein
MLLKLKKTDPELKCQEREMEMKKREVKMIIN